jgi:hypothetical protein
LQKIQNKCALARAFALFRGLFLTVLTVLTACGSATEPESIANVAPEEEPVLLCGNEGRLWTELYGAIAIEVDWNKNDLECAGMPRPEGRGARLRFAGKTADGDLQLAIIIAIPDLERDAQHGEFSVNVTLIEEGIGRFFSTPDLNNCLVDITSATGLDDSGGRYSIAGELFCVTPLPEINGDSSVSVPKMLFSGLLDWGSL